MRVLGFRVLGFRESLRVSLWAHHLHGGLAKIPQLKVPPIPQMSSAFLVVEPSKIIFLIEKALPKRRIESYPILGTIVSPNKILLT